MKKFLAMVMVFMLTFSTAAFAGPYVGIYGGPNFNSTSTVETNLFGVKSYVGTNNNTGVVFGGFVGYDFNDKTRFPQWARYFDVNMDFGYNPYNFPYQNNLPGLFANQYALAFMLNAKAILMESKAYPNGRVFPYVGVGPAVVFTNVDFSPLGGNYNSTTSTNVGVMTEAGVRAMITPQVSAAVAFRYRYVPTSYNVGVNTSWKQDVNNFGAVVKVAYHF